MSSPRALDARHDLVDVVEISVAHLREAGTEIVE